MATNVQNVIRAIEKLDMNLLWQLALIDPVGVLRKISVRQIGSRRVDRLLAHIKGMDHKPLDANRSFLVLVENLCLEELGSGIFAREVFKGSGKPLEGDKQTKKTSKNNVHPPELPQQDDLPAESLGECNHSLDIVPESSKPKRNAKKKQTDGESGERLKTRQEIIDYLNDKAGKNFRYSTKAHNNLIDGRLEEGYKVDDFRKVIDNQVSVWLDNPDMNAYLSPSTLFRPSNFETYLNSKSANLKHKAKEKQTGNPGGKPKDKYENFYL